MRVLLKTTFTTKEKKEPMSNYTKTNLNSGDDASRLAARRVTFARASQRSARPAPRRASQRARPLCHFLSSYTKKLEPNFKAVSSARFAGLAWSARRPPPGSKRMAATPSSFAGRPRGRLAHVFASYFLLQSLPFSF